MQTCSLWNILGMKPTSSITHSDRVFFRDTHKVKIHCTGIDQHTDMENVVLIILTTEVLIKDIENHDLTRL